MKIKYSYSKCQLDKAVEFIAKNNSHFLNQNDYIENSIMDTMDEISNKFPSCTMMATMGYTIYADITEESIDYDHNEIMFDILVDPALSSGKFALVGDFQEVIKIIKKE